MTIIISNPEIKKAIDLVSKRAGNEKRIFSPDPLNEPYWHHLVRVYYWLVKKGETDISILVSAVLHDAIEDNHLTADEIKELFADEVAEIVQLLSERIYSDHNSNADRAYYFQEIDNYPNRSIRDKALKIKLSDRYDNLIGLSFTNLELKKEQYRREAEQFFNKFAQEFSMEDYMKEGLSILNEEIEKPDILLELVVD